MSGRAAVGTRVLLIILLLLPLVVDAGRQVEHSASSSAQVTTATDGAQHEHRRVAVRRCRAVHPTPDQQAKARSAVRRTGAPLVPVLAPDASGAAPVLRVPTYVHLVLPETMAPDYGVVSQQLAVLHAAYATGTLRVMFIVRRIFWHANTQWSQQLCDEPAEVSIAVRKKLRRGGADALNLYIAQLGGSCAADPAQPVLGYATFPENAQASPFADGVVVDIQTLPGNTNLPWGQGKTAVHEVGHWLGLLHTFEQGCSDPGDGVIDTPPQATPNTGGCDLARDTCPLTPGTDPITNFMDYSPDACMTQFTPGQMARVWELWHTFRAPLAQDPLWRQ